tara:strand:- start:110 stop:241 length:132 start_codon:yes stop_codon:yes gene_type:complete
MKLHASEITGPLNISGSITPDGSIPYILNEDSCLWELSGSRSE